MDIHKNNNHLKIIYLHQYFRKPEEGGAVRSYYLAKALVEQGHQVELITAYNQKKRQTIDYEGITIHYLPIYYDNSLGFVGRAWAFLRYFWQSFWLARQIKQADLVYAASVPMTVGITAILLKKFKKIPFCFEVGDLWPQAPIDLGFIRNYWLKKLLFWLEQQIYRQAKQVVVVSPSIAEAVAKIAPQKPILLIPNIADTNFFVPSTKNIPLMQKLGLENKFVVAYFGAVAYANHLEYLLKIAEYGQNNPHLQVHFLIIGVGGRLPEIQKQAQALQLKNLRFFPLLDKPALLELLTVVDAGYVSFLNQPILETCSPNKFFDSLAAGKLLISNVKGWLQTLVEDNQAGFYADPEKPAEFWQKIQAFLNDPSLLQTYQKNARKLAEAQFSRQVLGQKLGAFLEMGELPKGEL
jgi:glycosyltransferase involved in cell wall biosynthesis